MKAHGFDPPLKDKTRSLCGLVTLGNQRRKKLAQGLDTADLKMCKFCHHIIIEQTMLKRNGAA